MAHGVLHWLPALLNNLTDCVHAKTWQPNVDIYRIPKGWLLKFELAGVAPGDVHFQIEEHRLIIRGLRRDGCAGMPCHPYRMEIEYSRFERTLIFTESLENSLLSTEFSQGMLYVRIQKEPAL